MYVFVSWCYTSLAAEKAKANFTRRCKTLKDEGKADAAKALKEESCFSEYAKLLSLPSDSSDSDPTFDFLNGDLLAIKFVVPKFERVMTYLLPKRMKDSNKLPVSLAARSFLLTTFKGEWEGEKKGIGLNRVTFVGLAGVRELFRNFALACAALNEPLPYSLWASDSIVELPEDEDLTKMLTACASNAEESEATKYHSLLNVWLGTGISADNDSAVLVTASRKLGFKD